MIELSIWYILVLYAMSFLGLYMAIFWLLLMSSKKNLTDEPKEPTRFPFVSVLIPAHNEEKSIEKAINSVLNSKYPEDKLEVIVLPNGCTDNTEKVAKSIKNNKVKVFSLKKANKGSALNFGIKKAKGELIAVMDADSYVDKLAIRKMVPHLEEDDVAAVIPIVEIDNPKKFIQKIQWCEYTVAQFMYKLLSALGALYVTPGVLSTYKKNIVKKVGGFDKNSITEDAEIATRLQYNGYDIKSEVNSKGYTHGPSTWKDLYKQRLRWTRGLINIIFKYRKMWFNKKYGYLGSFIMPMVMIIAILSASLFIFIFIGIFLLRNKYIHTLNTLIFNFMNMGKVELTIEGIRTAILSRNILIYFFTLSLMGVGLIIFIKVKKILNNRKLYILPLIVFLTYYQLFLTSQWIIATIYEVFKVRKKW